jgi:hypothetical protein
MAGEEQHFARLDVETDLAQRLSPAGIELADVVEAQDRHGGDATSPWR